MVESLGVVEQSLEGVGLLVRAFVGERFEFEVQLVDLVVLVPNERRHVLDAFMQLLLNILSSVEVGFCRVDT